MGSDFRHRRTDVSCACNLPLLLPATPQDRPPCKTSRHGYGHLCHILQETRNSNSTAFHAALPLPRGSAHPH